MTNLIEQLSSNHPEWQQLSAKLNTAVTLASIVLTACQIGTWLARAIVQQQLSERAQIHKQWSFCSSCGTRLVSKGFVKRRILTLVGEVEWQRRVGRCPRHCYGSYRTPFDEMLEIQAYQQTSTELVRLGCLLAVFLPFNLASQVLLQLTGVVVSDDTICRWVQNAGQRAMEQLEAQLHKLGNEDLPPVEALDQQLISMPLIIAADGVTVPFRPQLKTPKGKVVWKEVKVALLARLGQHETQSGSMVKRLHRRRLVAALGSIDDFKPRL